MADRVAYNLYFPDKNSRTIFKRALAELAHRRDEFLYEAANGAVLEALGGVAGRKRTRSATQRRKAA